jgi:hypothetical protein
MENHTLSMKPESGYYIEFSLSTIHSLLVYNSLILEVAWTLWTEVGDLQAHKNIKYLVGKK